MIIVSCAAKVPDLVEKYHPDCVLSIATKVQIPQGIDHYFYNFADIEKPTPQNIQFAATKDHIENIKSLQYETVLIHCTQGQRRSPAAALILGSENNPQIYFDEMKSKAPYRRPNKWMLKLAGISIEDESLSVIPPRECYFIMS